MPHLHLPEHHDEADLVLAGQIAALMDSGELFIAWTHSGGAGARPSVPAELREPTNLTAELISVLFDCAGEFLRALTRPTLRSSPPQGGATA